MSRRTGGKISNLLPTGSVTRNTELVLVNAITFQGDWEYRFTTGRTERERFYKSPTRYVRMMHMTNVSPILRYADVQSLRSQVVELPYRDSHVVMYVVLPYRSQSVASLERKFQWNPNRLNLKRMPVSVSLPRFDVRSRVNLASKLRAMGMTDLFGAADLRGINGKRDLVVGDAFHEAYIKVTETGTQAGAATAVLTGRSYMQHVGVTFVANRPFLFLIWDRRTNSLLFSGRFRG